MSRDQGNEKTPSGQVARIGCLVFGVPILILASPLILAFMLWDNYRTRALRREFARRWPHKRGILVYSNSPHWQEYIEQKWLPRIGEHVVLLNWSARSQWAVEAPFEARVFRKFSGDREFNPLAIIFLPRVRTATVRAWLGSIRRGDPFGVFMPTARSIAVIPFFRAFKDLKHGKTHLLHTKEAELFSLCDVTNTADSA